MPALRTAFTRVSAVSKVKTPLSLWRYSGFMAFSAVKMLKCFFNISKRGPPMSVGEITLPTGKNDAYRSLRAGVSPAVLFVPFLIPFVLQHDKRKRITHKPVKRTAPPVRFKAASLACVIISHYVTVLEYAEELC
jgi:hypothetical protein